MVFVTRRVIDRRGKQCYPRYIMAATTLKKILVVDDDPEILELLSNILSRANYEVVTVPRGQEVMELANSQKPDLIILDIVMPDLGGSEVSSALMASPNTANIPVIFLTGIMSKQEERSVDIKDSKRCVLAKPTTPEELLRTINKLLSNQ